MNRVVIITCYYGKLPEWFNIWVESCKYNPKFDYIIVTDNSISNLPKNIKVIYLEFKKLKQIFSDAIGFDVALNSPYKLCDYKPVYGKAFKKYISNYEFWGHCDLDLIWGDLSKFITDDILNKYDLIGKYGHLKIYKNNEKMNNLFKKKGGIFSYKKVYSHNENFGFDEMTGMNRVAIKNNINNLNHLKIANMTSRLKRFKSDDTEATKEFYIWKNGKILRIFLENENIKFDEYAYMHFSGKKPKNALIEKNDINPNIYLDSILIENRNYNALSKKELEERNRFIDKKNDRAEIKKYKKVNMKNFLKKNLYQKSILVKIKFFLTIKSIKEKIK